MTAWTAWREWSCQCGLHTYGHEYVARAFDPEPCSICGSGPFRLVTMWSHWRVDAR